MKHNNTPQNRKNWNVFFFWSFLALELYWIPSLFREFTTLKLALVLVYAAIIIKSGLEILKSNRQ